ncbi:MAG: EAL domain-containing protein [Gammaproteobacteria bacterium]|nr:EAL domain-containing protein [Gammaproteobacteria bacterium]
MNRRAIWKFNLTPLMSSTSSFETHSEPRGLGRLLPLGRELVQRSRWVWYLYWLPLLAAILYWYLSLALLDRDHQQDHAIDMLAKLDRYSQPSVPRDATQLIVDLRLLIPELALLDPEGLTAIRENVDVLESELRASIGDDKARDSILAELNKLHHALLLITRTNMERGAELEEALVVLLVLFSVIGVVMVVVSAIQRADKLGRPAWAYSGIEDLLFQHVPGGAVFTDRDDRIVAVNEAYERMTGYSQDEVVGRDIAFNHSGQQDEAFYISMRSSLLAQKKWSGEFWLRNKSGEAFADKVSRIKLVGRYGRELGYLTLSQDAIGQDDANQLMLWQAHHDTLTQLPNRNLFQERMTQTLLRAADGDHLSALISVDLDRFKIVNDSEGPSKGDQILMEAAYRIAMCARESDTVARLGGDHFVVLLAELDDAGEVGRVAHKIVEEVARPFHSDNRELYISASVGVAMIPTDGAETGELLQKADAARIQVKEQGGNSVAFFEVAMNARAERRMLLETELRTAIAEDGLALHYQPIIDIKRGEVASGEALLRWPHPELGMISPGEFIPVAEDSGLIIEVGEWVARQCKRQLVEWRAAGLESLRVSLNVSAVQIRHDSDVQRLLDILREGDNQGIVLELTESALIDNSDGVHEFLREARSLGCQIALDDFGTGFSSLGYLRDYEFDTLKVDKTFIDELANPRDYGLVASIVSMGRILGMRVVAEGVETAEQVQQLKQIGCDFIQGFHFSKPLPADEFYRFVADTELRDVG